MYTLIMIAGVFIVFGIFNYIAKDHAAAHKLMKEPNRVCTPRLLTRRHFLYGYTLYVEYPRLTMLEDRLFITWRRTPAGIKKKADRIRGLQQKKERALSDDSWMEV